MSEPYILDFKGYRLEGSEAALEEMSGIYCVYAGIYNQVRDTVSLRRLLYIGRAENIRLRMMQHKAAGDFQGLKEKGEILCYSRAGLKASELVRCEAAMIFEHKDDLPGNSQSTQEFHHDTTHVITMGRNRFLHTDFTVNRTEDH